MNGVLEFEKWCLVLCITLMWSKFCSAISYKIGGMPNEFVMLAIKIIKQNFEFSSCLLLAMCNKVWGERVNKGYPI